jgi:hypothetical protein
LDQERGKEFASVKDSEITAGSRSFVLRNNFLLFIRSLIRGYNNLLKEKASSLLMLLG